VIAVSLLVLLGLVCALIVAQGRRDEAQQVGAGQVGAALVLGAAQWNGDPSPVLRARLDHALDLYRRNGNLEGEATALDGLGHIEQQSGRPESAVQHYERALALFDGRHAYHLAETFDRLAECRASLGDAARARAAWDGALALYENQQRDADVTRVRGRLDEL